MSRNVRKASGDIQEFSAEKVADLLTRIEVPADFISKILEQLEAELSEETSTAELRQLITDHLAQLPQPELFIARYNIKPALRKFGPAGHTFERYTAKLLEADGFTNIQTPVLIEGECISHEIDVIATKDGENHMVECKFHNEDGIKSDVSVALYVYARFEDVRHSSSMPGGFQHVWLATNTKVTSEAEKYAACKGMHLLSMEKPYGSSILDRVVRQDLFPVSSLRILEPHLDALVENDIILLAQLWESDSMQLAEKTGIPLQTLQEAQHLASKIFAH